MSNYIVHGTVNMADDVYYKLIVSHDGYVTIACLQWFDEHDYNQNRFIRNSKGEIHVFADKELAIQKINEWFALHEIDPEYRRIVADDSKLVRE